MSVHAQTAVTLQPPNLAGSIAGSLPGQAGVSPTGSANYRIPLKLPPGTAGVEPSLSLNYDSKGSEGIAGVGWSVSGLSTITRCPSTLAVDNYVGKVSLDANDRYCLDGQRLLLVTGTYGAQAEYRTEVDSISRIKSVGTDPAAGPTSWTVELKTGRILTYGATADSYLESPANGKRLFWSINRIEDLRGTYLTVSYVKNASTGEHYPSAIRYSGRASGVNPEPFAAVRFEYEAGTRPDPIIRYQAGVRTLIAKRLSKMVTVSGTAADGTGGTVVSQYQLGYQQSPSSLRSLVSSIAWCDGAGACLPATTFGYEIHDSSKRNFSAPGSGVWGGPYATFKTAAQSLSNVLQSIKFGDINGDGRTDLFRSMEDGTWKVCLSTGTGFDCQTWSGPTRWTDDFLTGDFNGDGLVDLLLTKTDPWQVCLPTGSSFNCQTWTGVMSSAIGAIANMPPSFRYVVGDVDGDGRDDVIVLGRGLCKSNGAGFDCTAFTSTGFFDPNWALYAEPENSCSLSTARWTPIMGDFNGDKRLDVLPVAFEDPNCAYLWTATPNNSFDMCLSGDTATSCTRVVSNLGTDLPFVKFPNNMVADLNGDGYADFVLQGLSAGLLGKMRVCLSDGMGGVSCTEYTPASSAEESGLLYVADFDGDGRPDLLQGSHLCQVVGGALSCSAWTVPVPSGVPGETFPIYADFNGDGKPDLAFYNKNTAAWRIALAHPATADALISVTNGVGHTTQFTHTSVSETAVYTRGTAVSYPKRNSNGSQAVVSQMRVSNALGGWLATNYRYGAKRSNLRGRGDLGFEVVETIDPIKGITTKVTASQDFPFIGMPIEIRSTQSNGIVLSRTTNTQASLATAGGALCTYVKTSVNERRDFNAAVMPTTTTAIDDAPGGIDSYCNVRRVTETTVDGSETFTTLTVNEWESRTTPWLVSLLKRKSVSKTSNLPGTPPPPPPGPSLALTGCTATNPTTSPAAATTSCTLGNASATAATGVSYVSPTGTVVAGPSSCAANTANCGTVSVTSSTSPGTYAGELSATPSPAGGGASLSLSLTVNPSPPSLNLTGCLSVTPTTAPNAATLTCVLGNSGQTAASSVAYASAAGTTVSGPASCAAGVSNCGNVVVTTSGTAGSYSGTLSATPSPTGTAASAAVSLTVNVPPTPPSLSISACSSNSPSTSPTPVTLTCTVGNVGQTAASAIAYATPAGTTVSGPTSCAASTANCGTLTVTTGAAAATYAGAVSATPSPAGTAGSTSISLVVNATPPALSLVGCAATSPTTSPTAATMSCTLRNTGQTAATAVTYSSAAGTTAGGPATCAANSTNCGTVTVTTGTSPATYSGTLSAAPNPAGSAGTAAVSLTVNPNPPALYFTGCTANSPRITPTAATLACTLGNSGQTTANAVTYSTAPGTTVSGPSTCGAGSANCGTVTVSSGTAVGTYSGTLSALPSPIGTAASTAVSLTVSPGTPALSAAPASVSFGTIGKGKLSVITTVTITNTGTATAAMTWGLSYTAGTSSNGDFTTNTTACASLAAGSSCSVTVRYVASCTGGTRSGNLTASGAGFAALAIPLTATTSSSGTCL